MRNRANRGAGIFVVVACLMIPPVLYVLSFGPAVLAVENDVLSEDSFEAAYYPLLVVADKCPSLGAVLESYAGLWESLVV